MPAPRLEPFQQIAKFVSSKRGDYAEEIARGHWSTEQKARELVGRIAALDEVYSEMERISGPGTHFGERDI